MDSLQHYAEYKPPYLAGSAPTALCLIQNAAIELRRSVSLISLYLLRRRSGLHNKAAYLLLL